MSTEDDQLEEAFGKLLKKIQDTPRLVLSDEEWMTIIARERDGLPACCGNISSLRDVLIGIARDNGEIGFLHATALAQRIVWCFPDHAVPSDVIQKILDQLDYSHPDIERHVPDRLEL